MTAHRSAVEDVVNEKMADPRYAQMLSDCMKEIRAGGYPPLFVDAVVQKDWRDGPLNVYDAHALLVVQQGTVNGTIATCAVTVGEYPGPDCAIDGNNAILSRLPAGFSAQFAPTRGGNATSDGAISWSFRLGAHSMRISEDEREHENLLVRMEPGRAPLEVGTTAGSRTLLHLAEFGCVCRWPYGSKQMLLIFQVDGFHGAETEVLGRELCRCRRHAQDYIDTGDE